MSSKTMAHVKALALGAKKLVKPDRITHRYPLVKQVPHPGYRGFIVLNESKCIGCSLCARVCPASAMKMVKLEPKKLRPVINLGRCIFCGFCVDICPTEALFHSKSHDKVFDNVEATMYTLKEFTVNPDGKAFAGVVKVRVVLDEEKGIRYERVD